MEIRYGKLEDREKAREIWQKCFLDSQEEVDFYFENLYKKENYLLIEEDLKLVGSLHENKYTLSIGDNVIKSFFIVGVAVLPEFRGRGYMQQLISYSLENAKKNGYPFVYLTAINPDIYRRYGFEYVSQIDAYSLEISEIDNFKVEAEMEVLEIKESNYRGYLKDMIKIYENEMQKYFFHVKRDEETFVKLLKEIFSDGGEVYLFAKDGVVKGYLIFYRGDKITIREMFGKDMRTVENMLGFIRRFKEYYSNIEINSPSGKNMELYFKNQKKVEKRVKPFILGRILNPIEFLKHLNTGLKGIKLRIEDKVIPSNTGVYYFSESGEIEFLGEADWDMSIDIGSLASLLLGYVSIENLVFMGKIEIKEVLEEEIKKIKTFNLNSGYLQDYQ